MLVLNKLHTHCSHSENPGTCAYPFEICGGCGKVFCRYHIQTLAHQPYGCPCPQCGARLFDPCPHREYETIELRPDFKSTIGDKKITSLTRLK